MIAQAFTQDRFKQVGEYLSDGSVRNGIRAEDPRERVA